MERMYDIERLINAFKIVQVKEGEEQAKIIVEKIKKICLEEPIFKKAFESLPENMDNLHIGKKNGISNQQQSGVKINNEFSKLDINSEEKRIAEDLSEIFNFLNMKQNDETEKSQAEFSKKDKNGLQDRKCWYAIFKIFGNKSGKIEVDELENIFKAIGFSEFCAKVAKSKLINQASLVCETGEIKFEHLYIWLDLWIIDGEFEKSVAEENTKNSVPSTETDYSSQSSTNRNVFNENFRFQFSRESDKTEDLRKKYEKIDLNEDNDDYSLQSNDTLVHTENDSFENFHMNHSDDILSDDEFYQSDQKNHESSQKNSPSVDDGYATPSSIPNLDDLAGNFSNMENEAFFEARNSDENGFNCNPKFENDWSFKLGTDQKESTRRRKIHSSSKKTQAASNLQNKSKINKIDTTTFNFPKTPQKSQQFANSQQNIFNFLNEKTSNDERKIPHTENKAGFGFSAFGKAMNFSSQRDFSSKFEFKIKPETKPFFKAPSFKFNSTEKSNFSGENIFTGQFQNKSSSLKEKEKVSFPLSNSATESAKKKQKKKATKRKGKGRMKKSDDSIGCKSPAKKNFSRNDFEGSNSSSEEDKATDNSYQRHIRERNLLEKQNAEKLEQQKLKQLNTQIERHASNGRDFYINEKYESSALEYEQAIKHMKEMMSKYNSDEIRSKFFTLMSNRSATFMMLKMFSFALKDCDEVLGNNSECLKALLRKSRALIMMGNIDTAVASLKMCSNKSNEVLRNLLYGDRKSREVMENFSTESSRELENVIRIRKHLHHMDTYYQEGMYEQSLNHAKLGIKLSMLNIRFNTKNVFLLLKMRKYDEAAQACLDYAVGLDLSENGLTSSIFKGKYSSKNSPPFKTATLILLNSEYFLKSLMQALRLSGKTEEAIECLGMLVERNVNWARMWHTLCKSKKALKEKADSLYKNGKYNEAAGEYTNLLQLDEEDNVGNSRLFCNRAAAYMALGKYNEALRDCSEAIKLCSGYNKAYLRRARVLKFLSKWNASSMDYETYISNYTYSYSDFPGHLSAVREELQEVYLTINNIKNGVGSKKGSEKKSNKARGKNSANKSQKGGAKEDSWHSKYEPEYRSFHNSKHRSRNRKEQSSECDYGHEKCFYDILQIESSASRRDVIVAYRRLALQFHPDKSSAPDTSEKFKQITEAYDVLKDEESRRKYDQGLIS